MVEKVLELNREKTIFWGIIGALVITAGFYIYFINATIHNTIARENLEAEASTLALKIGNKEFEYITKRNSITIALARSMGYKEGKVAAYIKGNEVNSVAFLSR